MNIFGKSSKTLLPGSLALVALFFIAACGGDDENGLGTGCEEHEECPDQQVCLASVCVDEPAQGEACADLHEGEEFGELRCDDGEWTEPGGTPVDNNQTPDCGGQETCAAGEICVDDQCIDEPTEGASCPASLEGEQYRELQCLDGTWQPEDVETPSKTLVVATEPPAQIVAGESFEVAVALLDDEQPLEASEVELTVELSQGEFATGESIATSMTDSSGVATFELTIERADTELTLTASADHDGFEDARASTDSFDVIAAAALPANSWISGQDGTADGESVATIEVELFDEFGNPTIGVVPTFSATGAGNAFHDCSPVDEEGIATCGMTSTEVGSKTLEITAPVEVTGETIYFWPPCEESDSPFGGGAGSEDDPYRICSAEHLNAVGANPDNLDRHFMLFRDIDMAGVEDFNIIGDADIGDEEGNSFEGTFNGRGFTIENLTIHRPGGANVGLFGHVSEGALLREIILKGADITGHFRVAALAGRNWGTIIDCHVDATIALDSTGAPGNNPNSAHLGGLVGTHYGTISESSAAGSMDAQFRVGGLVGTSFGDISDCHASVDIVGERDLGGLVGASERGPGGGLQTIENCYATGRVEGTSSVGGLVGSNASAISDSYATGEVVGLEEGLATGGLVGSNSGDITNSHATGDVVGVERVGGLVGSHGSSGFGGQSGVEISESYATGQVSGTERVGGLIGQNSGVVRESHADGAVQGETSVGGLIGLGLSNSSNISNSHASGSVDGDTGVGGLIGTQNSGLLSESYATGEVNGVDRVGGLVGHNLSNAAIIDSYATGTANGQGESVGGLVGRHANNALIRGSYALGDVFGEQGGVGGLVGLSEEGPRIEDSFAMGDAHLTGAGAEALGVGGLVGHLDDGEITHCYATGEAVGGQREGGLVGWRQSGEITASFWDEDTSNAEEGVGEGDASSVTSLATDEFDDPAKFTEWDFEERWVIGEAPDGEQRPIFQWQN